VDPTPCAEGAQAPPPRPERWARPERLAPLFLAAAAFTLHVACWDRYGPFRDELYFLACGDRLAWGYVDQPPGIAVVARLASELFGVWVPGLRLLPWLAAAGTVYLTGRLAVRLGGGAAGAGLASAAALAAPVLLGLGHYLTLNVFELLLAAALAQVLVRLAQGDDPRLWAAAGGLAGGAVLFKYTAALLVLSWLAGLLLSPSRRVLRTRWLLAGAGVGALLALPNLAWQAGHGFPFLELVSRGQAVKNAPFSVGGFLGSAVLEVHPLGAVVALAGLGWALAPRRRAGPARVASGPASLDAEAAARPLADAARPLALGSLLYLLVLVATRGKSYYAAPAHPALLAIGGAALGPVLARRAWAAVAAPAVLVVAGLALAPLAIPLLPAPVLVRWQDALRVKPPALERNALGALPQLFADQHGWPELARAVAAAAATLTPAERSTAIVFGANYGEAAAVDVLGRALGLDVPPAVSGHNQYWLWGVPEGRGDPVLDIAGGSSACGGLFERAEVGARVPPSPWVMPYEDGRVIWICRGLRRPLPELWPGLRNYQ
jgi:hypothetical protein